MKIVLKSDQPAQTLYLAGGLKQFHKYVTPAEPCTSLSVLLFARAFYFSNLSTLFLIHSQYVYYAAYYRKAITEIEKESRNGMIKIISPHALHNHVCL